jgi:hypothetical protein
LFSFSPGSTESHSGSHTFSPMKQEQPFFKHLQHHRLFLVFRHRSSVNRHHPS